MGAQISAQESVLNRPDFIDFVSEKTLSGDEQSHCWDRILDFDIVILEQDPPMSSEPVLAFCRKLGIGKLEILN
jgi:hypothetical protein